MVAVNLLEVFIATGRGESIIRVGAGHILSVEISGIGRGLVLQSGDWSARRTGIGRKECDLRVGASGIQR